MASGLGLIKAQIATDIETTDAELAFNKVVEESHSLPYAEFIIGGADLDYDCNSVIDAYHEMDVWITGSTEDEVEELLETLRKLWMGGGNTRFNVLRGLGVIDITPTTQTSPVGSTTEQKFYGYLKFDLIVRTTYA